MKILKEIGRKDKVMKKTTYITTEEKEKCRRVAEAFTELYELTDTVVMDAEEYGLVKI
jgi:hypothetical protein